MKDKNHFFDILSQFVIPIFTIGAQALTAFKHPELGLIANLIAQPFWLYSSWQACKVK